VAAATARLRRRIRVCRRGQSIRSVRRRMEAMEIDSLWLLFLWLMVCISASARWILFLHKIFGETVCLKSCVSLVWVLLLPGDWISPLGLASMAERLVVVLRVLVRCLGSFRFVAAEGGWRAKSERSTADVLPSLISCSLPFGVHLSICFGLVGGLKIGGAGWRPWRLRRFYVWRLKMTCRDLDVICVLLRVASANLRFLPPSLGTEGTDRRRARGEEETRQGATFPRPRGALSCGNAATRKGKPSQRTQRAIPRAPPYGASTACCLANHHRRRGGQPDSTGGRS